MQNSSVNSKIDWDHKDLASHFDTFKPIDEIHPDAAVNIYVGWPTFLEQLNYQKSFLGKEMLNILDFGCGVGGLCHEFSIRGNNVIGVDGAEEMLEIAQKNSNNKIKILSVDDLQKEECKQLYETIDFITAMHSFDWIEDLESTFKTLDKFLAKNGLILFAVFPVEHIKESLKIGHEFEKFDSEENPTKGVWNFEGIEIPVFVRKPEFYDETFRKIGYEKVLEYYPQYPKEFINKYGWVGAKYPEMVIFGYRKV